MKSETKKKASASCKGKKKEAKNFMYTDKKGQIVYLDQYGNKGSGLFRVRVRKYETTYGSIVIAADSTTIASVEAPKTLAKNNGLGLEVAEGFEHCNIRYSTDYLNTGALGPVISHLAGIDKDEVDLLNDVSESLRTMRVHVGDLRKILKSCEGVADVELVPHKITVEPKGPIPPEATVEQKENDK